MRLADAFSSIQIRLELVRYPPWMAKVKGVVRDPEPWLDVSVEARTPAGSWACEADCLRVDEAQWIARWFRALARGEETHQSLDFEEPTLMFEFLGREGSKLHLQIVMDYDCRPPWLGDVASDVPPLPIDLRIGRTTLVAAADDLDSQIRRLGLS